MRRKDEQEYGIDINQMRKILDESSDPHIMPQVFSQFFPADLDFMSEKQFAEQMQRCELELIQSTGQFKIKDMNESEKSPLPT